ncbi:hypothetical protein PV721_31100 [Streptomyces sp. MB09-01]|uniref:hypothetical protein n=1 Tax=Streptomyces sp. MB09-01 TaxID=3028666 RepID=UPI00299FB50B|nr:hypothetical protein [Streptomyces sp. MB09-01]MDX3538713.1 hypothetical protein [Streptomyces sp. MB09-01]
MHDRYNVMTGQPLSPPAVSAKDLEGLAAALNALEHPLGAINELTPDMVELAFNSLRPGNRQKLLGSLGIRMAAPRRAGRALCQDILARLRRDARQHKCRCGIRDLTATVSDQICEVVFASEGKTVSDPASRWGATLLRTTVFAWCQASVVHAYVLAWAADQGWFTETADEEESLRLAAVADEARSVVAAYPDLDCIRKGFERLPTGDGKGEAATVADRRDSSEGDFDSAVSGPVALQGAAVTAAEGAGAEEGTDPEAVCRQLESALLVARRAAENVIGVLADGCPPREEDVAALGALSSRFDLADSVFRAVGMTGVPRRLEDMAQAAREYQRGRDHDARAREALRGLLDVAGLPDSAPADVAAEAVRAAAGRLLEAAVWGQEQQQEGAALADLARLLRKGRQAYEATEILALQDQMVRVLPACAMAVVVADHLVLAQPEESAEPAEGKAMRVPVTAQGAVEASGESAAGSTTTERAVLVAEQTDGRPAGRPGDRASEGRQPRAVPASEALAAKPTADRADTDQASAGASADEPAASAADPEATLAAAPAPVPAAAPAALSELAAAASRDTEVHAAELAPQTNADEAESDEAESDEAAAETVLTHLVVQRRFGLAHRVASAAGHPEPQVAALRLAGAAGLLTPGDSRGARLTADLLQQYGGYAGRDAEGSELVLLPALLRTALITGDHLAGAQLKALAPRLPERLAEAATAVADRALSGALMTASPLAVSADVSGAEARLRELLEGCRALLVPPRLRFARATEIAKRWLANDGLLGSLLATVAADDRDGAAQVREQTERLSKLPEINNEIDRMDRKHRSPSGKPLQGSGRQDLVHLVERAVVLAKEWCLAVDTIRRGDRSDDNRVVKEVSSLRRSLLDGREAVLNELKQLARSSGAVNGATAWAAHASMEELFDLLAGKAATPPPGSPVDPELVLDAELLKVCNGRNERPPLARLLAAVGRSWQDAFAERLAHDAFASARTLVELAERGLLPGAQPGEFSAPAAAEIDARAALRRTELRGQHQELVAELHRAQADGAVTDDQDLRLQELLADAVRLLDDTGGDDLVDVRRALDTVRGDLPDFRKQAADRIRARLDALDVSQELRAQVLRHLGTGGLATAADLVYFLEIGEDVPEIDGGESLLTDFFPAVPDGLPKGINRALIDLVRSGGTHQDIPVLDYSALSTDEAALAADALDGWRALADTEPKDRLDVAASRQLPPLLKLLGYDVKSARPLDAQSSHRHRREFRLFEATGVEINGRAKAPAFGSQIGEQGATLPVLMVWGRPPAKVVMSLAERDTSGTGLLVVYFGTISREHRVELAVGSGQLQPLLVVDDAAMAYLAARGNRQVSAATQTLLPFSSVNPYIREKRGRIGGEMFYGRDAERNSIIKPHGTQVIFGGRGLGKSALLADAGEKFVEQRPGYHRVVYVNLDQENIGKGSSLGLRALWSVLDRKLAEAQVTSGRPQGGRSRQDISERVCEIIRSWTGEDSRRRLLILLDECDQFFEADAPRFEQTKKLKGIGHDTKDHAKVVFAGLHSVQRFSKLASNGPFGHLAQTPTVIGPLAPQSAAELLVDPMRALGFEFQDMDLVNRVLGYCSYQPFLLQMFGHRLVELMHRKRARRGAEGPPYAVELSDIEIVESDAGLRDSISAAFKDTLSLDHRYDVIANVLAYHARHRGLEARLSDAELREECETFWRKGFEQLDTEGFRAYLSEMVGLGVLAPNHDGQGWHLRGPNALRMIGTSHEVDARLLRAEQECELRESIVLEGRPELPDHRPAPLTITQLDDLLGERSNQTRVVLGTTATGIGDVDYTLRTIAGRVADWTLPPVGRPSVYKQELTGGRPRERRVVISDFARYPDARPEAPRQALDLAETMLPYTPGVTRAVVIVTDPTQLGLWRPLLTGTEPTSAAPVVLRRHDRRSLSGWAELVQEFHTEDRLDRLHELTGGWPLLVDRAHRLHGELDDPDAALHRLANLRGNRAEARTFAEATGVFTDPLIATGYRALTEQFADTAFDLESAVTAVALSIEDEDEAHWIVTCLDALQVFDRIKGESEANQIGTCLDGLQVLNRNHLLRLEPLLRECVALLD